MRYANDILLPHELLHGASAIHKQSSILVPHTLQRRALKLGQLTSTLHTAVTETLHVQAAARLCPYLPAGPTLFFQ